MSKELVPVIIYGIAATNIPSAEDFLVAENIK